jgi:hypothetical protein
VTAAALELPAVAAETPLFSETWGGRPTLDAVVSSAWEGLSARASVPCPVCAGELSPLPAADGGAATGRCHDCGSELS